MSMSLIETADLSQKAWLVFEHDVAVEDRRCPEVRADGGWFGEHSGEWSGGVRRV
jgi:hypothetical protein